MHCPGIQFSGHGCAVHLKLSCLKAGVLSNLHSVTLQHQAPYMLYKRYKYLLNEYKIGTYSFSFSWLLHFFIPLELERTKVRWVMKYDSRNGHVKKQMHMCTSTELDVTNLSKHRVYIRLLKTLLLFSLRSLSLFLFRNGLDLNLFLSCLSRSVFDAALTFAITLNSKFSVQFPDHPCTNHETPVSVH